MGLFSKKKKTNDKVTESEQKQPEVQILFKENLKYISQTEIKLLI